MPRLEPGNIPVQVPHHHLWHELEGQRIGAGLPVKDCDTNLELGEHLTVAGMDIARAVGDFDQAGFQLRNDSIPGGTAAYQSASKLKSYAVLKSS